MKEINEVITTAVVPTFPKGFFYIYRRPLVRVDDILKLVGGEYLGIKVPQTGFISIEDWLRNYVFVEHDNS